MATRKKKNKHQMGADDVVTGAGQGKDQYGRRFGKKHASAMMEFTKNLWLQDSTTSLRNLLQKEVAQNKFREFLATEYGEAQLDFFLDIQRLQYVPHEQQPPIIMGIYNNFMSAQGQGIGQQERTAETQELWDYANSQGPDQVDPMTALNRLRGEAETILGMLAFDAFPRFLQSKYCQAVMTEMRSSNPADAAALEGTLNAAGSKMPKDADDWLNMFISTAESFPACIVICDMTIPGAPMVFLNSEFTRTTGYTKEEAVGRNCRFLQGPETEPESIAVIRNTLSQGKDCHVKLTNYRKNGEMFQNLLSMKPVFDADGIYRYVIGVQFEIVNDQSLKKRLVQLDKLLRLLPSRLNLKSKAKSRARGKLAANVTGEANSAINNKESIVAAELEEGDAAEGPRVMLEDEIDLDCEHMNFDNTIFCFTRIMWLSQGTKAVAAVLQDPATAKLMTAMSKTCGIVMEGHLEFYLQAQAIRMAAPHDKDRLARKLHRVMDHNQLFYCTNNEIVVGNMPRTDFGPILQEVENKAQQSLQFLTTDLFPRFLNSKFGLACVRQLRARELKDEQLPVHTVAHGKSQKSSGFWLEMFKVMSEAVSVAMVVCDMTVPGIPFAYVNEGFTRLTGYPKDNAIGRNARFMVGEETEGYVTDEIVDALRQHEPGCFKLHNYKANGQKFQQMFCLHPVFGPDGDYKYQIGLQVEMKACPEITRQLVEMERVLRLLPFSVTAEDDIDIKRLLPLGYTGDSTLVIRIADMAGGGSSGSTGGSGGGMGGMDMGMGMGGMDMGGMMGGMGSMSLGGMGGGSGGSGPSEVDAGDQIKSDITIAGKKNKTHYGKKFGKKHKSAMLEFTKNLWLQDSTASLRNLLQKDVAQQKFREFLATEYGEAQLDFIIEVFRLEAMNPGQREKQAMNVYMQWLSVQGQGIGQQERTQNTQALWDQANSSGPSSVDPTTAYNTLKEESERTLGMLAFDAFPRFLKSKYCEAVMADLRRSNPNDAAALEGTLSAAGSQVAKDADDWLNMFISTAESFPACIVISDMTIPGAPMVYLNSEFTRTTGYTKEEAVGRNCRFLQGPDTEPESIAVIRNTLSQGKDCHVKLTNYRKNGEKFQNLLSMKPVFDADGIYRYVIGVQFEIVSDQNLKKKLVQLDKLLRLLPSRLNLKSKASAQARGALAAKTTGEANQMINAKEQILAAGDQREEMEAQQVTSRPKGKYKKKKGGMGGMGGATGNEGHIFAFTKIMWGADPVNALRFMLMDKQGYEAFGAYLKENGSTLSRMHLQFWGQAQQILSAQGPQQQQLAKSLHRVMVQNGLFYCTFNEITIGDLNKTSWPPIIQEMARWQQQTTFMFASDTFTRFLESAEAQAYIAALSQRERNGEQVAIKTVAYGKDQNDPNFWIETFKTMSESVPFGLVVSDMNIPGIPLAYVNEGFKRTTGYGKEVIGKNARFLTGPMTEGYMTEEIMEALRHGEKLFCKLQNHKADGSLFQCLLCLFPVYTADGEYKYQIGGQVDYDPRNPHTPMLVMAMERVFRTLSQTTTGDAPPAANEKTAEIEEFLQPYMISTVVPKAPPKAVQKKPTPGNYGKAPVTAAAPAPAPGAPAGGGWGAPAAAPAAAGGWGAPAAAPQGGGWGAPAAPAGPPGGWGGPQVPAAMGGPAPPAGGAPSWAAQQEPRAGASWAAAAPQQVGGW